VSDLLRLLVLAGIDADQDDARAMMQMGGEGKDSVRYGEFRRIFYQGILGQNEKEYMAGLSVAVPRAGHEVNKDRLRIRKCLMRMVWSNDLNFSRMVQWLGGLNNKSIKVFQSKEETAEILQIRPDNADLECFLELFDPTSFGIHDFRFVFSRGASVDHAIIYYSWCNRLFYHDIVSPVCPLSHSLCSLRFAVLPLFPVHCSLQ
jgi:hypothetical protein